MADAGIGSTPGRADDTSAPDVSIVLLCYNGEQYLDEVLRAIFAQRTSRRFEVIAIDSGSQDRTLQILSNHAVAVHEISNQEFGHGKTRNLGVRMARGELVVFLTQDATPAHDSWLQNLIATPLEDDHVAGAYSRQLPRDDCNPIERRDIQSGAGPITSMKRVDFEDEYQRRNYLEHKSEFMLFSNVSSCIRKDVLQRLPFNERLPMVEDQEWCRRAIEQGYTVVYEARSAVYHSHNHTLRQIYARHRDYGSSFREFADLAIDLRRVLFYAVTQSLADGAFVLRQRGGFLWKLKWILLAPLVRFAMRYGFSRGLRSRDAGSSV